MVTSTDLAIGLGRLVSGKVAGPAATTRMTETLRRQTYGESIGAGLPTGVEWGGKSGWMDDIRHDSAVVWPPDAPPYCLAVCTQGLDNEIEPTQDPTDDRNPAVTLIRDLSALIYAHRQAGADRMDDHRHAGDTT